MGDEGGNATDMALILRRTAGVFCSVLLAESEVGPPDGLERGDLVKDVLPDGVGGDLCLRLDV